MTGINETKLFEWTNMADLFRIKGIGQYAELLKAAGVDTVKELRNRNPENLHRKLIEINEERKVVRILPELDKVKLYIKYANTLEPVVLY